MEPTALATLDELKARLDWTLDGDEEHVASAALEDLSDDARFYGRDAWTDPEHTPRTVVKMVVRAAARYMRNPDGYTQSRAGDETLTWNEDRSGQAGAAHFNETEIKALRSMAGAGGIYSVPISAHNGGKKTAQVGFVPVPTSSEPFPMFADVIEPW